LKSHAAIDDVKNVIIWGNHSSTQYPDVNHGFIKGEQIRSVIKDDTWLNTDFLKAI